MPKHEYNKDVLKNEKSELGLSPVTFEYPLGKPTIDLLSFFMQIKEGQGRIITEWTETSK